MNYKFNRYKDINFLIQNNNNNKKNFLKKKILGLIGLNLLKKKIIIIKIKLHSTQLETQPLQGQ